MARLMPVSRSLAAPPCAWQPHPVRFRTDQATTRAYAAICYVDEGPADLGGEAAAVQRGRFKVDECDPGGFVSDHTRRPGPSNIDVTSGFLFLLRGNTTTDPGRIARQGKNVRPNRSRQSSHGQ